MKDTTEKPEPVYVLTQSELERLFDEQKQICNDRYNIGNAIKRPHPMIVSAPYPNYPPPLVVPCDDEITGTAYAEYLTQGTQTAFEEGANFILTKLGLKK